MTVINEPESLENGNAKLFRTRFRSRSIFIAYQHCCTNRTAVASAVIDRFPCFEDTNTILTPAVNYLQNSPRPWNQSKPSRLPHHDPMTLEKLIQQ